MESYPKIFFEQPQLHQCSPLAESLPSVILTNNRDVRRTERRVSLPFAGIPWTWTSTRRSSTKSLSRIPQSAWRRGGKRRQSSRNGERRRPPPFINRLRGRSNLSTFMKAYRKYSFTRLPPQKSTIKCWFVVSDQHKMLFLEEKNVVVSNHPRPPAYSTLS